MPLSTQFDERYFASVYGNYIRQNPPRKLRFYRELLERRLAPSPAPRVLDLGCAHGLFLAGLPRGFRKFGVDASYHALASAAARLPDAHFVNADCGAPPIASRFDAIVAFDVLEHIPAVDNTLEFVRQSLTPDGIFLFVVPVYDGPLGPIVNFLDSDPTHVHKRSREWWLGKVRDRFEVISWTGVVRYLVARRFYLHMPSSAIRAVAPAIAVAARLRGA